MISRISKMVLAGLATAGLAVFIPAGTASAAPVRPDINTVPCNNGEFLQVWWHSEDSAPRSNKTCLANAGTYEFHCIGGCWLDAFSTGNNVVQFESDGRWQPATPVGKHTYYTFPHYPGGVDLDAMKIH